MTQNIYPAAPIKTSNGETAQNYTGYAWAGKKYQHGLSTKEIAARVRAEIRAKYPMRDGYRIGVKYNSFSMGSSIDITIKAAPFEIYQPEYKDAYINKDWDAIKAMQELRRNAAGNDPIRNTSYEYTPETTELLDDLKTMIRAYRYDDSDGMIDYFSTNFYDHVTVDWKILANARENQ